MNNIIEDVYINPELNEIKNIITNTLKEYFQKYNNSFWKRLDYKSNIRLFDKIKNKTKNITTRHGPNRTIMASNGRNEHTEINTFIVIMEEIFKKML